MAQLFYIFRGKNILEDVYLIGARFVAVCDHGGNGHGTTGGKLIVSGEYNRHNGFHFSFFLSLRINTALHISFSVYSGVQSIREASAYCIRTGSAVRHILAHITQPQTESLLYA